MIVLNVILFLSKLVSGNNCVDPNILIKNEALPGQFPSAVALLTNEEALACSGNLIFDHLVVTAAYCIGKFVYVLAGDTTINGTSKYRQIRNVTHTIKHPKYGDCANLYDLGLAFVDKPFVLSQVVKPIELCSRPPRRGEVCKHAGWAVFRRPQLKNRLETSAYLMYQDIKIVSIKACPRLFRFEELVCSCSSDPASGLGDTGGPLIYQNKLCGVTSAQRIRGKSYNIFGNIPMARIWILTHGAKNESPTKILTWKKFTISIVLSNWITVKAQCRGYDL